MGRLVYGRMDEMQRKLLQIQAGRFDSSMRTLQGKEVPWLCRTPIHCEPVKHPLPFQCQSVKKRKNSGKRAPFRGYAYRPSVQEHFDRAISQPRL